MRVKQKTVAYILVLAIVVALIVIPVATTGLFSFNDMWYEIIGSPQRELEPGQTTEPAAPPFTDEPTPVPVIPLKECSGASTPTCSGKCNTAGDVCFHPMDISDFATQYYLAVNDKYTLCDKTITFKDIIHTYSPASDTVVVDVNGVQKKILVEDGAVAVNGLLVQVGEVFYSDTQIDRSATLWVACDKCYCAEYNANALGSCTDSDGKNPSEKGYVDGWMKDITGDIIESFKIYDECSGSGKQINEMWCYDNPDGKGQVRGRMVFDCANGCGWGRCNKAGKCSDSDYGKNYYIKGTTTVSEAYDDGSPPGTDTCRLSYESDHNTYSGDDVDSCDAGENCEIDEYFCDQDDLWHAWGHLMICPYGCSDGACINPNYESISGDCYDEDGGKDYGIKAMVYFRDDYGGIVAQVDECREGMAPAPKSSLFLVEYYCDENGEIAKEFGHQCANGCVDGACQ